MSLNKLIPKSSKSFSLNFKRLSEDKIKINYLDKPKNYFSKNISMNTANSFFKKKQPIYRNFELLLNKNNKHKSFICPKFNSIVRDKNVIKIQSDSTSLSLYKTKSNSYFDYKKKLFNQDENRVNNYFQKDSMIKKYNTNINIDKYRSKIKKELGCSFSPKNRIKAMEIYEILEFSDYQNSTNSNNLNYLKRKSLKNNKLRKKPVKYNNFINNAKSNNKNISILKYNNINKKEIRPINSLFETNNLENQDKIDNYPENNKNEENNKSIYNKKNKKIFKSFSQSYFPKKNNNEEINKNEDINNNENEILNTNNEDFYVITNSSEKNSQTLKIPTHNLFNNEIPKGKINENNNKTIKPSINNYLNKYRGDQKRIMEECINNLNFNYSDDNYNYNYQINYNDCNTFGSINKSNKYNEEKEPINQNINNEIEKNTYINNSINQQMINNNNNNNNSNNFKLDGEENKENINIINTIENNNEENIIPNNEKLNKNNNLNNKKYKDIFSNAQLINFQKHNKKKIKINLDYSDENIDFNQLYNKDNYLSYDNNNKLHNTKSYFNNTKNNLTTKLIKNGAHNPKYSSNRINRYEDIKNNKNKYSQNIQKFLNQKKKINVHNLHKKLSKVKFNFMNKQISVMPPNDYDREIITNVINDLYNQ